ncbi:TRAP transporter small permease [Halovulum dunhuangense]|uniref:TRAP transporter small permease protein n=1 Tax=Halovulum dunhuangense TaxID=1505036 RepID=A0A849L1H9_9RHOB|nr:TRAP transporter small permease [Halovulum dunhuangense]NNU80120.1 TRAP transporter small permease [Halovulum dunhuangense]
MRQLLDRVYLAAGWISAVIILGIAVLVSAQVALNFSTRVLGLPLPATIPSYADFAGFMLAAATFLAMPYTFRSGGHIRVSLVNGRLPERVRLPLEVAVLVIATGLVAFATWYVFALILESWHFGDKSSGMVPVPLWLPQSFMGLGMALLLVAAIDTLVQTIREGRLVIDSGEEA